MSTNKVAVALAAAALAVAALGATPVGHAAAQLILPKGSVGTPQLKAGAVTGLKVKDGSLAAVDFKAGELPAGAKGEKGDPGPQGPKGDPGTPGLSGYEVASGTIATVNAGATHLGQVSCPSGKKALSGGFVSQADMATIYSYPYNGGGGWYIRVKNLGGSAELFKPVAVCANVGQ